MDDKEYNHIRRTFLNDLLIVTSGCETIADVRKKIGDKLRELQADEAEREGNLGAADTIRRIDPEF